MFDLHSHLLPGIDDGAADIGVSLEMAAIYLDQGVECVACTPHILPGVYHNTGPKIRADVASLQATLFDAGLDLKLVPGADNHVVPAFTQKIREGHLLCIADSRYVLVEPPHHVAPPRLDELFFSILVADYVPILTHPERLSWIEDHYQMMIELVRRGVWMQITSGALVGHFGRRPKYWAERMLAEGLVHILASDAHDTKRRPPDLAKGQAIAEGIVGATEAHNLVVVRPKGILLNQSPIELPQLTEVAQRIGAGGELSHAYQNHANSRSGVGLFSRVRNLFGN
jgi:protein-tyrosine phosphatase